MNEIINMRNLCVMLAESAGMDESAAEKLLNALFENLAASLENEGTAYLPGVGHFRADRETAEVVFEPDSDFAEAVNEPFSFFEAVELNVESSRLEELQEQEQEQEAPETDIVPEPVPETVALEEVSSQESESTEPKPEIPVGADEDAEELDSESKNSTDEEDPREMDDTDPDECEKVEIIRETRTWPVIAGVLAGLVTGIIIGFLAKDNIPWLRSDSPAPAQEDINVLATKVDTVAVYLVDNPADAAAADSSVSAEAARPVVTDTVTTRRFLATMARKYYGVMEYWVFIYDENKDILPENPNRIKPGTVVVIPPMEKYVPDGDKAKGREKAARMIGNIERNLSR